MILAFTPNGCFWIVSRTSSALSGTTARTAIPSDERENISNPKSSQTPLTSGCTGYGRDGSIWGGEIFCGPITALERVGQLEQFSLPGGDLATKYPLRSLLSLLSHNFKKEEIIDITADLVNTLPKGKEEVEFVLNQLEKDV
ncbi:unnamed protein product, partial [marine sediment metagenome]